MAFTQTAQLNGSTQLYQVSPQCKRYTLRDNGFVETKAGNFQFVRTLDDAEGAHKKGLRLKVVVSKDLSQLKMSTTTSNGLQAVNVYQLKDMDMVIEKLEFILAGFVNRDVLVEVTQ